MTLNKKITQKNWDFQLPSSQFFFAKISGIGLWVSTINWCKGHWCGSTYLVVRLSDIKGQFTVKNAILLFLALFWTDVRQPDDHIDWELGVLKISVCLSWSFDFFLLQCSVYYVLQQPSTAWLGPLFGRYPSKELSLLPPAMHCEHLYFYYIFLIQATNLTIFYLTNFRFPHNNSFIILPLLW